MTTTVKLPITPTVIDIVDTAGLYNSLTADDAEFCRGAATNIKKSLREGIKKLVEAGNYLIAVKQRLNHGQWGIWLSSEFQWAPDKAEALMRIPALIDQYPQMMKFGVHHLSFSILSELSKASTPTDIIDDTINRLENGDPPTVRELRNEIRLAKSTKPCFAVGNLVLFLGVPYGIGRITQINLNQGNTVYVVKTHRGKLVEKIEKLLSPCLRQQEKGVDRPKVGGKYKIWGLSTISDPYHLNDCEILDCTKDKFCSVRVLDRDDRPTGKFLRISTWELWHDENPITEFVPPDPMPLQENPDGEENLSDNSAPYSSDAIKNHLQRAAAEIRDAITLSNSQSQKISLLWDAIALIEEAQK